MRKELKLFKDQKRYVNNFIHFIFIEHECYSKNYIMSVFFFSLDILKMQRIHKHAFHKYLKLTAIFFE